MSIMVRRYRLCCVRWVIMSLISVVGVWEALWCDKRFVELMCAIANRFILVTEYCELFVIIAHIRDFFAGFVREGYLIVCLMMQWM